MDIKIGPTGIGGIKEAIDNLEMFARAGIRAAEIAFTYSVYIKKEEDLKKIGEKARELGIDLSIHAQYFVNLNSKEPEKIEATKKRIIECCYAGEKMGAKTVVFHPGYYGDNKENAFNKIKEGIIEIQEVIKKNNWQIKIAPETMGKINVFGSVDEISRLSKETGCSFCIDFAHVLAREKKIDYEKIARAFPQKEWHCHFSGIEYGEKGEKNHIKTEKEAWKELFNNLKKYAPDRKIIIINESPVNVEDSIEGLEIYEENY